MKTLLQILNLGGLYNKALEKTMRNHQTLGQELNQNAAQITCGGAPDGAEGAMYYMN